MRASCLTVASFLLAPLGFAATTSVNTLWTDNFIDALDPLAVGPLRDSMGTPLTSGDPFAANDGAIFQIGYFNLVDDLGTPENERLKDPATYTAADWAMFTPITGIGSANPGIATSIGDGGTRSEGFVGIGVDGFYTIGVTFDTNTDAGLPNSTSRIGVRFFESTDSPTGPSNIVTSADPTWQLSAPASPAPPPAGASLDPGASSSPGGPSISLVWANGPGSAFSSIPEPSSSLLALLGAAFLLRRRR